MIFIVFLIINPLCPNIFVSLQFEMRRIFCWPVLLTAIVFAVVACSPAPSGSRMNLRLRGSIDNLNKASFLNRYSNPSYSISKAYASLELLHDSLPTYHDGIMRAYNNLAFGYYMLAEYDSTSAYIDSVLKLSDKALPPSIFALRKNAEVERVLAQLTKIRILQRSCRIADSYQLLYDINRSKVLKHNPENYLYSFAQMEYSITSLTLNYHYRNRAVASSSGTTLGTVTKQDMHSLITEVEAMRPGLKCDYDEEMSLNYALAHSYYRLASASNGDARLLGRAYDYLIQNARILSLPNQFSVYHLANVFQLQAFVAADTNIPVKTYRVQCARHLAILDSLCSPLVETHPDVSYDSLLATDSYGLEMFRISTDLFFLTSDPYQHLGAVVAAAEYCLQKGLFNEACDYYSLALNDTTWHDGMAPKFESMLYYGLITSGYSSSPDDNALWFENEISLLDYINQNERADLMLQDLLFRSETRNRYYSIVILLGSLSLVALIVLVLLLRHRSRVLRREKQYLQEAKRQDVERIANVETCLSVLRHDINPFLSYLTNKKLSEEMRQEVLDQLLRTFSNIKSWTNLSIPKGLQFQASVFPLNDVFDSVAASCVRLEHDVDLVIYPTTLNINGDRQLTEILLRNLVNNALQHTTEGKVSVYAELLPEDNRFVHIEVQDTGTGMDEETIDNLFRADKKVNNPDPDAPHGSGFGLILCKYIIKRHDDNTLRGCRIWAESTLGQGSTFHCLLAGSDNQEWTPDPWRNPSSQNHTHGTDKDNDC